jgi:hypothetical protein
MKKKWKLIDSINCRIIDIYDKIVVLECLVDIKSKTFEERNISKSLFKYFDDTYFGKLILLKIYQKPSQMKVKAIDGDKIIDPNLFPNEKLIEMLKKSKLFNK